MISSRANERDSLLFVYGTLRPFARIRMSLWLGAVAQHVGTARTRGRLYDLGPYPGMLAAQRRGEWVVGDVYRLRDRRSILRALDRYEGGPPGRGKRPYLRVLRDVRLAGANGAAERQRRAWLYLYQHTMRARTERITHGDYRKFVLERRREKSLPKNR